MGIIGGGIWALVAATVFVAAVLGAIYYKARYKVPPADKALVITGGKKGLRVLPGRGAYVGVTERHQLFPINVMTVRSDDQETQTKTLIPVIVRWTAQLRTDLETEGALEKAVRGFSGYATDDEIADSLKQTLDGEVRAVVATMTPEQVVQDKDGFSTQVAEGVQQRMTDLGFNLVSLNIAEVTDRNGHYKNLAAEDRETRRKIAETLAAQADQHVAVQRAQADQISQGAQLDRDLAVAVKNREVTTRKAEIEREMAEAEGSVAVAKEQQLQTAAEARRAVTLTEAETEGQRAEIAARAEAEREKISAQTAAAIDQEKAKSDADAAVLRAEGEARAIARTTESRAAQVRQQGLAEAEVARAKGEAEAAATLAKGRADAEVLRLNAEALAANDGANLQLELAKINGQTQVEVAQAVATALAGVGKNATFIDMGGRSADGGDLLSKVLGNLPTLFKQLDVQSLALQGVPFGQSVGNLVSAVTGGKPATSEDTPGATPTVLVDETPEEVAPVAPEEESVIVVEPTNGADDTK